MPVSVYPTTGYPMYPVAPPKVPTRTGPWLWVLAATCAVLMAGIGVFAYLISAANTSHEETVARQVAEIDSLEQDVQEQEDLNDSVQDDTDHFAELLADDQAVLADLEQCPAAVQASIDAARSGDEAQANQAWADMLEICHIF